MRKGSVLPLLLGFFALATARPSVPLRTETLPDTRVYYYGFFTNVNVPISEKAIEDCYDLTSIVRPIVPEMIKILSADERPFIEGRSLDVRLKMVPSKGPSIMLDFCGNVYGLGKPHRISPQSEQKLRRLIFSSFPEDWPPVEPGSAPVHSLRRF